MRAERRVTGGWSPWVVAVVRMVVRMVARLAMRRLARRTTDASEPD